MSTASQKYLAAWRALAPRLRGDAMTELYEVSNPLTRNARDVAAKLLYAASKPEAQRTIDCSACRGTGRAPLPPSYAETLALLPAAGTATAGWVAARLGIAKPAACNRLAWLVRHGFATSRGYGSRYNPKLYSRAAAILRALGRPEVKGAAFMAMVRRVGDPGVSVLASSKPPKKRRQLRAVLDEKEKRAVMARLADDRRGPHCKSNHDGWVCDLKPRHRGDHEAWATEEVEEGKPLELMATWPKPKRAAKGKARS